MRVCYLRDRFNWCSGKAVIKLAQIHGINKVKSCLTAYTAKKYSTRGVRMTMAAESIHFHSSTTLMSSGGLRTAIQVIIKQPEMKNKNIPVTMTGQISNALLVFVMCLAQKGLIVSRSAPHLRLYTRSSGELILIQNFSKASGQMRPPLANRERRALNYFQQE